MASEIRSVWKRFTLNAYITICPKVMMDFDDEMDGIKIFAGEEE
jgi:hypothetical protein